LVIKACACFVYSARAFAFAASSVALVALFILDKFYIINYYCCHCNATSDIRLPKFSKENIFSLA
jgi:hypothetical protein